MEYPNFPPATETPPQRPTVLTVLCILTFIGSGMNTVSSFFVAAYYDTVVEMAGVFAEKFNLPGLEAITAARPVYFLVSGLCYIGSLAGAWLMFLLKKVGFHVYTVCQILLILVPMYFLHLPAPGFAEVLFSGLFVLLYSRHLKLMS